MTQIASSPKSHQLHGSGRGLPRMFREGDLASQGLMAQGLAALSGAEAGPLQPVLQEAADGSEELLAAVWRTSSYVESVQWELDAAQGSLVQAVQQAAESGVEHAQLCKAANLTAEELASALQELPPALLAEF